MTAEEFRDALIAGRRLSGGTVEEEVVLNRIGFGDAVVVRDMRFREPVRFLDVEFLGTVLFDNCMFRRGLVFAEQSRCRKDVRIVRSSIAGDYDVRGSRITGALDIHA